jgi:hypothetical protein
VTALPREGNALRERRLPACFRAILCGMNSSLAALEARSTLQKMNRLRDEIKIFATHARMLNASSKNFDSANLLEVATQLLGNLGAARLEFAGASNKIETLARALPSRTRNGVGMSPAAKWVPELRAASKQFAAAVREAEQAIGQLRGTALDGLNSPTRTATPDLPTNLFDIILNFSDLLTALIERYKSDHKRR